MDRPSPTTRRRARKAALSLRQLIDEAKEARDFSRASSLEQRLHRLTAYVCSEPWAEALALQRPTPSASEYPPRHDGRALMRLSRARIRLGRGAPRQRWTPADAVEWEDEADITGRVIYPSSPGVLWHYADVNRGYQMREPDE